MGALAAKALRPIKSFNIENRAHRVISKEKPTPAPRYAANLEDLKRALESDPNLDEKLDKKDLGLDTRLKNVYVTSHGKPEDDITREKQNPDRPLPQDRGIVQDFDYGFKEPERVKYGHTTLRNAVEFISAHQIDPKEVTVGKIALQYKLKEEDVENILKYFITYEVYLPETKKSPATFAGPATLRKQLYKEEVKEIEGEAQKKPDEKGNFWKYEIEEGNKNR
ncbi:protein NDUFAF4 homolog [Leguminivora glycinivorella]|uniref:protein NDUFAF4 homolog n=1 Tax=Leguminivora glycinivorella TaxID=1035111 RepID=UPI00200F55E7|nr:protein NDUFAF4 homolog [Leguminivora glycinivorella]